MRLIAVIRVLIIALGYVATATACDSVTARKNEFLGAAPLLMHDYMVEIGCAPIKNFYSDYSVMEPPFVWLSYENFAFVCERSSSISDTAYELVLNTSKEGTPFFSCPRKIRLQGKPGGLSIEWKTILESNFIRLIDGKPLQSIAASKLPILSIAIGSGGYMELACIGSNWYFNTYS